MLTYVIGNLFESPAHVLVNTVNTVGVMGKGIAKEFKMIYPEMFRKYQNLCETKQLIVGKLWLYKTTFKWILNFPTKTTWREPSRVEYIEKGLQAFVKGYAEKGITNIAFPALGCGNGELDWEKQVRPLMEKYLKPLSRSIEIFIYIYPKNIFIPEHRDSKSISAWLRSEPESLSFQEVWEDVKKLSDGKKEFLSFYKKIPFRISSSKDGEEEYLRIVWADGNETIYYEALLDFWKTLRSYGFVFPAVMPSIVDRSQDYVLAIFAELPYCREIGIVNGYRELKPMMDRGLQFLPRSANSSPLFNSSRLERLIAV